MPVITLLTDLGYADWYQATLKAQLLRLIPEAQVVDITHGIRKFDVQQAAFVMQNSYTWFPPGTIHLISVEPSVHFDQPYVAIQFADQFFIGTDNGFFSLLFGQAKLQKAVTLHHVEPDWQKSTLEIRDIFVPAARMLVSGRKIEELGKPLVSLYEQVAFNPAYSGTGLQFHVRYTDGFGNVITNLTKADFQQKVGDKKFTILLRSKRYNITKIGRSYHSVGQGDMVALFNSGDVLEIAVNHGSASELLGLGVGDRLVLEIHENNTDSPLGF
jgi:S-adenosylmethionine hydrolase